VQFLHPHLLWFGLLALPLVLFYILKVKREEKPVGSTLLWRQAMAEMQAQIPFRRLRRDWLLLLELLILSALVLAAAGPFRETLVTRGRRSVLVLDASSSMLSQERFAQAKGDAAKLLSGMKAGDQVLLIRAGTLPQVAVPFSNDRDGLTGTLSKMSPGLAVADLSGAVSLGRKLAGPDGEVFLFTDGTRPIPEDPRLNVILHGSPAGNSGLVAMSVRPRDASGRAHDVFSRLRNASDLPASGVLRLTIDGRTQGAASLTLPPEGSLSHVFRLDGQEEGLIEIDWQPEERDVFPEDERAQWVLRKPVARRFKAPADLDPALARALSVNADWQPASRDADIEIATGREPEQSGPPVLWVNPADRVAGTVQGGVVLNWMKTHPSLRFVDLSAVRLGTLSVFTPTSGSRVLASSSAGPLIVEGRIGSRRAIIWSFDLSETDLPQRSSFPILVRNTLENLAGGSEFLPGGIPTGEERETGWPVDETLRLTSPSGITGTLQVVNGSVRLPAMEETGLYELAGANRKVRFAASLLAEAATDVRPRARPKTAGTKATGSETESWRTPNLLLKPFAIIALGLLLLDALAFHRRWSP
jgi:hypothetical protein